MRYFTLYFDGSCWPNPLGTGAIGYILSEADIELASEHEVIGTGSEMSNNTAEFQAVYRGLKALSSVLGEERGGILTVRGDSQLVIKIMNKRWKARSHRLYYNSYILARNELISLRKKGLVVTFDWIPRELNQKCDKLSKKHLTN